MPEERWRVAPSELTIAYTPEELPFETTADITQPPPAPPHSTIGQERAVRALNFGLGLKRTGYNVFVTGPQGSGRSTHARQIALARAREEPVPGDWVYVYNFRSPDRPLALHLPPGMGLKLAEGMDLLVAELRVRIPRAFGSEEYQRQRGNLLQSAQDRSNALLTEVEQAAREHGFALRRSSAGLVSVPLTGAEPLSAEEFARLPPARREEIEARAREVQALVEETLRRIRAVEKEAREAVEALDRQVALLVVRPAMAELREAFAAFPRVLEFLDAVEADLLKNIDLFREQEGEAGGPLLPLVRLPQEARFHRYKVNPFVTHEGEQGAPVVVETNPTYYNLFGKIEYRNHLGALVTDFTMIKPGAVHRANGGYLILQAQDLLTSFMSWEALKRVLKTGEAKVEDLGESFRLVPAAGLNPEPIPVQLKVILIGHPLLYHLLYLYDEDFGKLFKIKADFATDMPRTPENVRTYVSFIAGQARERGLLPFHRDAVARILQHSSRLAEDRNKLSLRLHEIIDLMVEASAWASQEGRSMVTGHDVRRAVAEKVYRSNLLEERIFERIRDGQVLVDVTGEAVGQVNGISVIDLGDYTFGKPTRITARVYLGDEGILDIERESKLSGNIHHKGVLILAGYLGGEYARDHPLSLSARLVFEQLYEEVEGDSAASAELYALLSALSGLPIRQGIAVTGSVNQRGEIQPVGGVTEKVEGFFAACRLKGLTGEQGVIIPAQNLGNLILQEPVLEAVAAGRFHIWAIRHVDEGIEILTGVPAGKRGPDGTFPPDTVHGRVQARLREMATALAEFGRSADPSESGGAADHSPTQRASPPA